VGENHEPRISKDDHAFYICVGISDTPFCHTESRNTKRGKGGELVDGNMRGGALFSLLFLSTERRTTLQKTQNVR
jgi:hypothetical protein